MTNENFKPGALGSNINKVLGKALENHGQKVGDANYIRMGREVQQNPDLYASFSSVQGFSELTASDGAWMLFEMVVDQMVDDVWKEKMVGNEFEEGTELDAGAGYSVVVPQYNNVGVFKPYNYSTFTGQTNQLITGPSVVAPTENNVVYKMSLFDNFFNPSNGQEYTLPWLSFAEAMPLDKVVKLISVSPAKLTEIYNTIFNRSKAIREIVYNNWDKYKFTIFAPRNTYTTQSTNVQDFITNFLVPVVGDMTFANANYNGGSNWYQYMSQYRFATSEPFLIPMWQIDPNTGILTKVFKLIVTPTTTTDESYVDWLNFYNEFLEPTAYYQTQTTNGVTTLVNPNAPFTGSLTYYSGGFNVNAYANGQVMDANGNLVNTPAILTIPEMESHGWWSNGELVTNSLWTATVNTITISTLYQNEWYSALPTYSQNNAAPAINSGRLLPVPFLENTDPYDDLVIFMNYKTMSKLLAWYSTNAIGDNRFSVDTNGDKPYITKIVGVKVQVAGQIYPLPQYVQQGAPQHNSVIKREALPDGYICIMSKSYIEWHKYIDETYSTGILPASLVNQYITTMSYLPIVKPWRKGLMINCQSIFSANSSALNVNILSEPSTNPNNGNPVKMVALVGDGGIQKGVLGSETNPLYTKENS